MYARIFATFLCAGCATTATSPPPSPAPSPAPPEDRPPLLSVELPVLSAEQLTAVTTAVEGAMTQAHGYARTAAAFAIPAVDESVGQVGWSGREVMFAISDDVIGTIDRDVPCGPAALRLGWRALPVGRAWDGTLIESVPQWWRVGDAWVRVGATELVGVAVDARPQGDCSVWGVLVEGPPRVDAEVKSPGSSGPTDGMIVNVFGEDTNLVVAPTGVTLGVEPAVVQMAPAFEATCVHVRWAADLLGTRTLRVRFTNGPQADGCPAGDKTEEFARAIGPDGELARTERVRREPVVTERQDYVVRRVGAGRLLWEATSTTVASMEGACATTVETKTGRWTLKHPTRPPHTAVGRRTRTQTACADAADPSRAAHQHREP